MPRRSPSLTPEEARQLHYEALVIDSQQPPATSGLLFTESMKAALEECSAKGMSRYEVGDLMATMAAREIVSSPEARQQYLDIWNKAGVTVACGTYEAVGAPDLAYDNAVRGISEAHSIIGALDGELILVRTADDIERAHESGKHGLVIDFQNTTPFGSDLDRINYFHGLGLRMVQLTYNLRNLVGDGCTETYKTGLTYYGREVVQRLNELSMIVDVSHCSEQVGWDAIEVSSAPVIVSHSSSAAVCYHDRGKSDDLAKAIADNGGFFGVVIVPGFLQETPKGTLDDFTRHLEHLINVMGIDHVGIGTDKAGPGPGTESMIEYPFDMPRHTPEGFNWSGFRLKEHRLEPHYKLLGYDDFRDWSNITVHLAEQGFTEDELRKLLGTNFLQVFREVVG